MDLDPFPSQILESSDGFIEVKKKGKKRAAVSISPPPPAKAICSPSGSLPSSSVQDTEAPANTQPRPTKLPPPFLVHDKIKWEEVRSLLSLSQIDILSAKSTQLGIKVQVKSADCHRQITRILREKCIGFHTYALEDEKHLRVVIRGVPKELSKELILEDLTKQGYPVKEVHRLYSGKDKTPFDLVLVILDKSPEGKAIFNLKTVCHLSGLSVETPHRNGTPAQCHRCQFYGHSARFCFARPRCVKCLGDHSTTECSRTRDSPDPPSCVLCGNQGHTANYRGCPKAPRTRGPQRHPSSRRPIPPLIPRSQAPPHSAPQFVAAPLPTTNAWPNLKHSAPLATKPSPPAKVPTQAETRPPIPPLMASPITHLKLSPDVFKSIQLMLAVDVDAIIAFHNDMTSIDPNDTAHVFRVLFAHLETIRMVQSFLPPLP